MIIHCGSRNLRGIRTHYNEIITLVFAHQRVSAIQLIQNGAYRYVTMIEESRPPGCCIAR